MFSNRPKRQPYAKGFVSPDTGTDTVGGIKSIFAPRLFPAHVATVGYDYDFHPGCDFPMDVGDEYLCPINGHVIRSHRTHFEFPTTQYQNYWTVDDDGFGGTFSHAAPGLAISGTRGGSNSFPNCLKYVNESPVSMTLDNWEIRLKLGDETAIAGALGFGFFDTATSEYVTMEWDGGDVRALGARSGGALTEHNSFDMHVPGDVWLRIRSEGGTLQWAHSADGESWTDYWTETNPTFTNASQATWRAVLYYRSTDNDTPADAMAVDYIGWYDDNTVPRFGNWATIAGEDFKVMTFHLGDLYVDSGDIVAAGQALGTVGLTGFDDRSGPIQTPHVHLEYHPNTLSAYSRAEGVNPLRAGILPRENVSNNVAVTMSEANDPDGVASWKMAVVVTRADQDFDINAFELVGTSATRTVNWDSRSGLNADVDIPKQSGVYFVPGSFNGESATYTVDVYFNKSVVGAYWTEASVTDSAGVELWSDTETLPDAFPATAAGLNTALGLNTARAWNSIYTCQDSSGNLADSLGVASFVRGAAGSISYQQSGPTASQKSIKSNTATGSGGNVIFKRDNFAFSAGSSVAWLGAFRIHTWAANQTLGTLGVNPGDDSKLVLPYTSGTNTITMRTYKAAATIDPATPIQVAGAAHTDSWFPFLFVATPSGEKFATSAGVATNTSDLDFSLASWTSSHDIGLFSGGWGTGLVSSCAYYAITIDTDTCADLFADPAAALAAWQALWI